MQKISTVPRSGSRIFKAPQLTIGLDVGDRWSRYCVLNEVGDIVLERRLTTTAEAMKQVFGRMPRSRIALETGTHSLVRLSERARRSPSLQKMLDMQTAFRTDPEKKLAPLFDIVELIEAEYQGESGAAKALGVSRKALGEVKKIANNPAIRTARHPGQAAGALRDITPDELGHCVRTIAAIISEYARQVSL